jgi:prolipoprotein diacylglyceryltransferase
MYFLWNPDPIAITFADMPVSWYGLLFALGFLFSQRFMIYVYTVERKPAHEILLVYLIVGTAVGARLGHCLFYDPAFYLSHPTNILRIWEGGLASHGAAIGILVTLYIFARRYPEQGYLWLVDRIVICASMVGFLVRVGNFVNSEIPGTPTQSGYGVVFAHDIVSSIQASNSGIKGVEMSAQRAGPEIAAGVVPITLGFRVVNSDRNVVEQLLRRDLPLAVEGNPLAAMNLEDGTLRGVRSTITDVPGGYHVTLMIHAIARHPVQVYEAAFYLVLCTFLLRYWYRKRSTIPHGLLLGWFLAVLFSFRFLVELVKEDKVILNILLPLKVGQLLSIPFVFLGLWMVRYAHSHYPTTPGHPAARESTPSDSRRKSQ